MLLTAFNFRKGLLFIFIDKFGAEVHSVRDEPKIGHKYKYELIHFTYCAMLEDIKLLIR